MTIFYLICAVISVLMTGVYFLVDKKRDIWLLCLFISVAVCDMGYLFLSVSKTLETALWANRFAYAGSVFLPFCLLMMIMHLSRFRFPQHLPKILVGINLVMLLIAASGGFLPIYYKEVSLEIINGSAVLIKEYGPLHGLYKIYLFAYFAAMVAIIIYTAIKKKVVSIKHSIFLAFVVIGNIAIWLVENTIHTEFEFLAISYIVTEGLILFLYGILQDYGLTDTERLPDIPVVPQQISIQPAEQNEDDNIKSFNAVQIENIINTWQAVETLSQREKEVLRFILENKKRKDIAQELFVTESTIKKHTANIFKKLEITNRTELFECAKKYYR